MPVAKSYSDMVIQGEPFQENGRMYVNVLAPKGLKKVRWYSDAEYRRMYPNSAVETDIMMTFNAREAFGFYKDGFITLYKGNEEIVKDWAQASWPPKAWYNLTFHFYTPSDMSIENLPEGITPIQLKWDEVKQDDIHMRAHEEVADYVRKLLDNGNDMVFNSSDYQGEEGTWIEKEITIKDKSTKENQFGKKHTYTMADAENNSYVWETGAKNYKIDEVIKLRMKVKDHKEIDGVKTTIVWYCKEL